MSRHRVTLRKMQTARAERVEYRLAGENGLLRVNDWIGSKLSLEFLGRIHCTACDKLVQKSYSGFCYGCFQSRPEADLCQMRPELCHHERGTCRDPAWGTANCLKPHSVYLARSSAVKVGITREEPPEIRWMDQGAVEGMVIARVPDRLNSGLVETALAQHMPDKTDFRKMLRGEMVADELLAVRERVVAFLPLHLRPFLLPVAELKVVKLRYPLEAPAPKLRTPDIEKEGRLSGLLLGIKGQYLVFDEFVFNVRSHSGYEFELQLEAVKTPEPAVNLFDLM